MIDMSALPGSLRVRKRLFPDVHRQVGVPGSQKRKQKWRFRQGAKDRDGETGTRPWFGCSTWVQGKRSSGSRQLTAQEADKNERKGIGFCSGFSADTAERELGWSLALQPLAYKPESLF